MLRSVATFLVGAMSCCSVLGAIVPVATLVKDPSAGMPFLAPEAALPAPWVAYQLSLQATAGELIGAVDVSITGNKLHQRWHESDFDGGVDPTPTGFLSNGRGDSHLTQPAGSPFGFGPFETNTKAGSPLTSVAGTTEYGVGNLAGAWAILAPSATTNLAYIVVQKCDLRLIDISIKAANSQGSGFTPFFGSSFFPQNSPPDIHLVDLGEVEQSAVIMAMLDDCPGNHATT